MLITFLRIKITNIDIKMRFFWLLQCHENVSLFQGNNAHIANPLTALFDLDNNSNNFYVY